MKAYVYLFYSSLKYLHLPISIPMEFLCLVWNIHSNISCKHITIAKLHPNLNDVPTPESIANPSEKLCITNTNIPPKVVPNVPKNRPNKVVFKISCIIKTP